MNGSVNNYNMICRQGKLEEIFDSERKLPASLMAEVKLLNIMKQHKMSMNCFPIIVERTKQSNKRKGFNFSNYNSHTMQTIMNDLHHCTGDIMKVNKVYPTSINWLPDN